MRSLPLLKTRFWTQSAAVLAAFVGLSMSANAQTLLISDNFGDGVGGNTGTVAEGAEANFFTTSSSAGIDNSFPVAGGGFRFISGTSGRAIHTTFTPTTLATAGDIIEVSFDFTTPDTVQGIPGSDEEFRFGLFDTSNAAGVNLFSGINTTAGVAGTDTGVPISFLDDIPSATANNQPGLLLRGFTSEIDIESDNPQGDISFRVSAIDGPAPDSNNPPSGRLTTTTNGFDGLGSGPDFGFLNDVDGDGNFDPGDGDTVNTIDPNTDYTATLTIELLASGDYEVTSSVDGGNLTAANTLATDTIFADLAAASAPGSGESVLGHRHL